MIPRVGFTAVVVKLVVPAPEFAAVVKQMKELWCSSDNNRECVETGGMRRYHRGCQVNN